MPQSINGQWKYRSFRNGPIQLQDGNSIDAKVLAVPWTTQADLDVKTNSNGSISGKLVFHTNNGDVVLDISGSTVQPDSANLFGQDIVGGVDLIGVFSSTGAKYQLRGWFIPGSDHLVGTIVALSNDLGGQPDGTSGPWVAFPAQDL